MTLAGLNTVNLSTLNTFQQFILFALLILGSAILVSIVVVHTRRKAFETRFKSIVEEEKQRRRDRGLLKKKVSSNKSLNRPGFEVDGMVVRGRTVISENHTSEKIDKAANSNSQDVPPTERQASSKLDEQERSEISENLEANQTFHQMGHHMPSLSINTAVTRRIMFASPSSPTRQREHGRILSMQGVGARPDIMNHPKQAERPVYPSDLPRLNEAEPADPARQDNLLYNGLIGRNSQFSNLSLAERQRIGGVEYRAVTILAVVVPIYFVLWQLLACIGLGAYVACNRSSVTLTNGLNPWYDGLRIQQNTANLYI